MGSIVFNNIKNPNKSDSGFKYVDLHLDVEENPIIIGRGGDTINGKDIKADYNVAAVINSLRNIFNTHPGERFLVPEFGSNLKRYLFEPITENTANKIGSEIIQAIDRWEPRVIVERPLYVLPQPDIHQYDVTVRISIIEIDQVIDLGGIIDVKESIILDNLKVVCPTN